MKFPKPTLLATLISTTVMSGILHAATSLDMAVVIDESGSMSGEHNAFIGTYVRNLDSLLNEQNVTLNRYGLVGFGGGSHSAIAPNEAGREIGTDFYRHFYLGLDPQRVWGTPDEFHAVTPQLETTGWFEDGYRAMDYAFRNFDFRPTAGSAIMLITDEDRDIDDVDLVTDHLPAGMSSIDKRYIQDQLARYNTVVHAVVQQRFTDKDGNTAVAVVGADPDTGFAYVKDENGVITKVTGYILVPTWDTTQQDYTELALASGGTAMDIDGLRSIYTDATALAALTGELAKLVAEIAVGQVPVIGIDCGSAQGVAAQICSAIAASNDGQLQQIGQQVNSADQYNQLSQYQVSQMLQTATANTRNVRRVVLDRLADMRRTGVAANDINLVNYATANVSLSPEMVEAMRVARGGAASADQGDTAFFVRGIYTRGDYDNTAVANGYESSTYTFVAGVDKYLSDAAQVGSAISYATTDADFSRVAGGTEAKTYGLTAYGSYEVAPQIYVEGNLGYSRADFDTRRDSGFGILRGDTRGNVWNLSVGALKTLDVGTVLLQPFTYLHYTDVAINGFTEKGGVAALRVGSSSIDSLVSEIGVTAAMQLSDSLTGDMRLGWEHEFKNSGTSVASSFVSSPNNVFHSKTPSQVSDYGRIGLGLTKGLAHNRSLAVRGETLVGHNRYDEYSLEIRYRQAF
jgi:outer membrane autotransporter protein